MGPWQLRKSFGDPSLLVLSRIGAVTPIASLQLTYIILDKLRFSGSKNKMLDSTL